MQQSFSEKFGYKKINSIGLTEIQPRLLNRLWNSTKDFIDNHHDRDDIIANIWDSFLGEDLENLKGFFGLDKIRYETRQIKERVLGAPWYTIYDLIQFLIQNAKEYSRREYSSSALIYAKQEFISLINTILEEERAPYRIIDNLITPLISQEEINEIEKAVSSDNRYSPSKEHIKKALGNFSKKPTPDYLGTIRESIHAVEAIVKIVLQKEKGTLGDLVKELNLHPSFKDAISKLYGWTADDASGIRHAAKLKEDKNTFDAGEPEARFMLVSCSAFVNFIIRKYTR